MRPDWVYEIWKSSRNDDYHATHKKFDIYELTQCDEGDEDAEPDIDKNEADDILMENDSVQHSVTCSTQVKFLNDFNVYIQGFYDDSRVSLVEACQTAGAKVVDNDKADFMILPLNSTMEIVEIRVKFPVNNNWIVRFLGLFDFRCMISIPFYYLLIHFTDSCNRKYSGDTG